MTADVTPGQRELDATGRLVLPLLAVLFALVPLSFVGTVVAGVQLTGLAWLAGLALSAPLAILRHVPAVALRWLLPYLAFATMLVLSLAWTSSLPLGLPAALQLLAPVPAFLVASTVRRPLDALRPIRTVCETGIWVALALTAAESLNLLPSLTPLSPRPMAIGLVVLFIGATVHADRRRTALLGAVVIGLALYTGGRTATAVLLVVVVLSPAWRVGWRGRVALGAAGLAAVAAFSTTSMFQERFFFNEQGTLGDALGGSAQLNTAGRRELWPQLLDECSDAPWTGHGPGAASAISARISLGALAQPHNDYLRLYCEVGVTGSLPFWFFMLAVAARAHAVARRGAPVGSAVLQGVAALLLLSVTDNPVIYTAHFMVPLAVLMGLACASASQRDRS